MRSDDNGDDDHDENYDNVVDNEPNTFSVHNTALKQFLMCVLQNIQTYMTNTEESKQRFWRIHMTDNATIHNVTDGTCT